MPLSKGCLQKACPVCPFLAMGTESRLCLPQSCGPYLRVPLSPFHIGCGISCGHCPLQGELHTATSPGGCSWGCTVLWRCPVLTLPCRLWREGAACLAQASGRVDSCFIEPKPLCSCLLPLFTGSTKKFSVLCHVGSVIVSQPGCYPTAAVVRGPYSKPAALWRVPASMGTCLAPGDPLTLSFTRVTQLAPSALAHRVPLAAAFPTAARLHEKGLGCSVTAGKAVWAGSLCSYTWPQQSQAVLWEHAQARGQAAAAVAGCVEHCWLRG